MIALGTLGGTQSGALALDDAGRIVGRSTLRNGRTHAFLWQDGRMTDLGALAGGDSRADAIGAGGRVVGTSAVAAGRDHAVLFAVL